MKKVSLSGALRTSSGSHDANRQRRDHRVPCVLYGGEKPTHFTVDSKQLDMVVFTPDAFRIELEIDGTKTMALLHETQFHPVTDKAIHADFVEMNENKESVVTLSLMLTGASKGVKEGGRLVQNFRKLKVKGLPSQLPEHLELDITPLDLNDSIRVSELDFKGITVLERATDVVVAVRHQKKEEVAAVVAPVTTEGAVAAAAAGAPGATPPAGAAPAAAPAATDAKKAEPKK